MSIYDEFAAIFADLPEHERLSAALDAILEGIEVGSIVAIPVPGEADDCTYKHVAHATPDEMERRLTIDEVRRHHQVLNRANMRHIN